MESNEGIRSNIMTQEIEAIRPVIDGIDDHHNNKRNVFTVIPGLDQKAEEIIFNLRNKKFFGYVVLDSLTKYLKKTGAINKDEITTGQMVRGMDNDYVVSVHKKTGRYLLTRNIKDLSDPRVQIHYTGKGHSADHPGIIERIQSNGYDKAKILEIVKGQGARICSIQLNRRRVPPDALESLETKIQYTNRSA